MELILCPWESAQYFVYSSNIPTLFFYSHIPAMIVALIVGFLVFYKTGKSKIGISLLVISILFVLWCLFDLIIWATNRPDVVMFYWSLQILVEPFVYLLSFYLLYVFIKNHDLSFEWKLFGLLLYSPVVLLLPTQYNLIGVDSAYCDATEGFIAQYFTYSLEALFIISILFLMILGARNIATRSRRKEIIIFGSGVILFLGAFSSGNLIGSFTEDWTLAQAGLIGMPIFVAFISYMIVRFKTFNIKLIATQVLMAVIWFLVLGVLMIRTIDNVRVITALTLILVTVAGDILIRSVTREVKQREQLAQLNIQLEDSIRQRESLVHLVTHKVKGSFTRSKYLFAGFLDGTFGPISDEVKKRAEQGLESDNMGLETVDLVLNVANMQKGIIKYEMKPLDFKAIVQKVMDEKKAAIEAKALKIEADMKDVDYNVSGDAFWLKEVVNNLVENSIKYSKAGTISVKLTKQEGKVLFSVKDTGIGITDEDKKNLFTEGGRGKDSVKVNVDSTGYGLYSVKLIVDGHQGRVWAESEGAGKGSTFLVELPVH